MHYVGAVSTAKNNTDYYKSVDRQASAHYFVDENSIWQCVEDKDKAWHCGGVIESSHHPYRNICTNSNSIGVEMCCKKTSEGEWYFEEATVKNTVDLICYLMRNYGISINNVIRHYDVTGKSCPKPYVDNIKWNEFRDRIRKELNPMKELETVNDIVWELEHRGIITNADLWLHKMETDSNVYWLCRKMVNYIINAESR